MNKRVKQMLVKDIQAARKDNIINYMVLIPLVLAVLMRLLLPMMESMELNFAVSQEVDHIMVTQLAEYGQVTVYDTREEVIDRVLRMDDVPGIVVGATGYEVILEGNEASAILELPGIIIDHVKHGEPITQLQRETLGVEKTITRYYAAVIMVFSVVMIGGVAVGMTIIEEKESKVMMAYSASPLRLTEYLMGKSLLAVFIILLLGMLTALIMMGTEVNMGMLLLALLASLPTGLVLGLAIGTFANDQMSAIALLKVLMVFFIWVPLGSMFISDKWHLFFYPFLNYWSMQSIISAMMDSGLNLWSNVLWALLTGLITLLIVLGQMKKRLGF
ncbi:MAG: ABC transporter permease [Bacillota bacterium]|nr:ABC transporter permease [Bacillota bacterium]